MFHAIVNFFTEFDILELSAMVLGFLFIAVLSGYSLWQSYLAEKYKKLYDETLKDSKRFHKLKNTYQAELKMFADLLDEINFPIWQRDKSQNIIYCNSRFCEIAGEIRENIIGKGNIDLFRGSREISVKAIKTGLTQVAEHNVVIDGMKILNQVVEIPVSDKSYGFNTKTGTIGFAINFNELQATRDRLKYNLELQKRLLESLNGAVAIYGANKKLEYFNEAFVNLWKLDGEWLNNGPTYSEILDALREKRKLPEQVDFQSFKKENDMMFNNLYSKKEIYYYLPDDSVLKVVIIPYQQRGLLFYYENLTEDLKLESKYNTLLSVQRQTLDNLNEAVAVFGEDGRLKLYNPSYSEIWGHTASLLNSEPHIRQLLDEEKYLYNFTDWDEFKDEFVARMQSRQISEIKLVRNDGIALLQRMTPLPDGATLLTYFDITDKESVEKSLRAEKRAYEEADKIKTNFLSNVSYELRSPLTSIMGFTEILLMEYFEKISTKSKEYLKAIFDSSVRLKNLIDNIIDVSSIDSGYVNINKTKFTFKEVFLGAIKEVEHEADRKKIKFNYKLPSGNLVINADKERLMQIIKTLILHCLSNAINGGSEVNFAVKQEKNNLIFEISDNGKPTPKEDLALIFDQFFKAHSDSISTNGVGLYLAKRVIELHGGFIVAESDKSGNRFTFEIPM